MLISASLALIHMLTLRQSCEVTRKNNEYQTNEGLHLVSPLERFLHIAFTLNSSNKHHHFVFSPRALKKCVVFVFFCFLFFSPCQNQALCVFFFLFYLFVLFSKATHTCMQHFNRSHLISFTLG